MNIPFIQAKSISYGAARTYDSVRYIVIHYTANNHDTATGNCKYFANGNTRSAGAHFFVSQNGDVCQSIKMNRVAWSVGDKRKSTGGGSYYGKCTNSNSVSIELCDNLERDPSVAQIQAIRELIAYIKSVCPNAGTVLRHYDVTGKLCPARMAKDENKWKTFHAAITQVGSSEGAAKTQQKEEFEMTEENKAAIQKMIDDSIAKALAGKDLPRPSGL